MMLHHRKQAQLWGCIYHSLYAVTGDESMLEHVDDLSELRALTRLHSAGLGVQTLHAAMFGGAQPTSKEFWIELMGRAPAGGGWLMLLTVPAERSDVRHAVAAGLYADRVIVSDSALDDYQVFSQTEFLSSKYAQADAVGIVFPLDLDRLEPLSAQKTLAELDAMRSAERDVEYVM